MHLRKCTDDRERALSRLYGVVLDRVARAVRRLIDSPQVSSVLKDARFTVVCSGGPTLVGGFAGALTDRFVEQDSADRILAIRVLDDPSMSTIRGLLIFGELESRRAEPISFAAWSFHGIVYAVASKPSERLKQGSNAIRECDPYSG